MCLEAARRTTGSATRCIECAEDCDFGPKLVLQERTTAQHILLHLAVVVNGLSTIRRKVDV